MTGAPHNPEEGCSTTGNQHQLFFLDHIHTLQLELLPKTAALPGSFTGEAEGPWWAQGPADLRHQHTTVHTTYTRPKE